MHRVRFRIPNHALNKDIRKWAGICKVQYVGHRYIQTKRIVEMSAVLAATSCSRTQLLAHLFAATPASQQVVSLSQSSCMCVAGQYARGTGVGEEQNHTTARKPFPL